jgi:hypothetical protein
MARSWLIVVLALVAVAPVFGHHSFSAVYLEHEMVSLAGELTELDYRSPHAWVRFTATDEQGLVQRYSAEWANPSRLGRDGITKDTLRPGDHVIVTGSPARNAASYTMHLKGIERPIDGWRWGRRAVR